MTPTRLIDTGPLVALLDRRDRYHSWAKEQVSGIDPPFLTCESVLSEGCFLLQHVPGGPAALLELVHRGLVISKLYLQDEIGPVQQMVERYANVPMDLADACLLRLAELEQNCVLLTLDSDFRIYRRSNRSAIPLHIPDDL